MAEYVVVAHKFLPQPDDDLVAYLNAAGRHRVLHIYHSFPDAPDRCSFYRLYENGVLAAQGSTRDYRRWAEPLVYVKEMFFTLKWTRALGRSWDCYVAMDGLCALFGNLLRAGNRVKRTVFWAIDFVPANRFGGRVKNLVYAAINKHGFTRSDEMWDLGPRMAEARARFGHVRRDQYRKHRVVPYGLWLGRLPRYEYDRCERDTVVFMGHLLEKQGVQLVLEALPAIIARVPGARLKIIGGGSYREALERRASELGVAAHCRFMGKIARMEDLEDEVARSAVAVAPYVRELDTWTAYADPGKVKTYLACGVPVALTDVPWNAREIADAGCGRIVTQDPLDIAASVVEMLDPAVNQRMREAALRYASGFDWSNILGAAIGDTKT